MEHILKSRYKIGEKLSENPFSITYKGFFVGTENPLIIKTYKRGTLNSSLIKMMRQKVRELSYLNCPGLAKLIDGDYGWQGFYYIREYIPGETLGEVLKQRKKLSTDEIISMGTEICKSLETAHEHGIIHGAISPSNIFITKEGHIKLADFIILGEIKEALPMKAIAVSENASYLSPEELKGTPATPLSDIYSLGTVLFELLTNQKPFLGEGLDLAINKLKENPKSLKELDPSLPRWIADIISQCLKKDPLLRFPHVSYLRESLSNKCVVLPPQKMEELSAIFNHCVSRYGEESIPEEHEPIEDIGRLRIKWNKEKHRTWLLAVAIGLAVVSGLLYAFLFVR